MKIVGESEENGEERCHCLAEMRKQRCGAVAPLFDSGNYRTPKHADPEREIAVFVRLLSDEHVVHNAYNNKSKPDVVIWGSCTVSIATQLPCLSCSTPQYGTLQLVSESHDPMLIDSVGMYGDAYET